MAKYYKLAIDSIQRVQNIVEGSSDTPMHLNGGQCKILAQELAKVGVHLRGISVKFKFRQGAWKIALLHLYSAIKKAELLLEKCCCEGSESWLVAAMTLVEIQEDFAAIIVDLHQWRLVLDFALASAHEKKEELLMIMDEEYEELYKRLRRSNHDLQQAAVEDKKKIGLKLAEFQESENSQEYLLAVHLQSWLAQFEDETQVTDLNVEQKLVEFEKPQNLGSGGCGTVFRVHWIGVECALKILNVKDEREAAALKGLLHPNIIRLYRYWEAPLNNPKSHLLMELMPVDLSVYIESLLKDMASPSTQGIGERESMPFSLPVAIDMMLQVGQAMQYLHDRHLTHRDLKTSNILVRRVSESLTSFYAEGYLDIKLADFGLAKAYDNTSTSHRHTVNTGTPVYGAPEIFGKDLASERNFPPMADVWSFGVTCAEILSGKKPYANEPRGTLQARIAKGNLRPTLPKLCPEYLAFMICSCWEFKPKRRPDFASVCRMLRHAKLLSLKITTEDDSRSFMAYTTRSGFVKGLRDPKAPQVRITSRFATFFQTSFKYLRLSTIPEVRKIRDEKGLEKGLVQGLDEAEEEEQRPSRLVSFSLVSFDLGDLLRASAEVLGKGSVGTAYKAILEDGTIMAVKRLKDVTPSRKEFETLIQLVGKLQHRNVVPLRAYYFSKDEKLLVSDFMPMGSLAALLHGDRSCEVPTHLDWLTRVRIAIDAAKGLAYLHAQGGPNFVHGNIKSSNILLNGDLQACISEFGLWKLQGTEVFGYRSPPEVKGTHYFKANQKSDVYSFGVLLLELLTGKAPSQAENEGIDLAGWVQSVAQEDWTAELIDLELMRYQNFEGEMVSMLQIAMLCVDPVPERRPNMNYVIYALEDVHPFSSDADDVDSGQSESLPEENSKSSETQGLTGC